MNKIKQMSHLEAEYSEFKNKLLLMASHAETMMVSAINSVIKRDEDLAEETKKMDSNIDRLEMELDNLGVNILSQAPLARDLRLITSGMKISSDLERIGDESTTIARRSSKLAADPRAIIPVNIERMGKIVGKMLAKSLSAFVSGDTDSAKNIITKDKEVDALNKEIRTDLILAIKQNPNSTESNLNIIFIAKSLERIGDHSKNIARDAVFLFEAKDIRHPNLSK
ncbi:MAG: phosphate transport system regulatory protein PhoU [Opitutia bacterium TMED67]|nr:phosphate transport system regulatory protein PhoU [Verrucomicrobiales bacterium]OUU75123.1 MAG: phosphate transport system regulatory protein PhoU [Opitutae bacterium TMED67]RZO54172.1 MAG: phosphate signaling complex protein PhoU [Limisphaerales bacterium]|tara:strand:- start:858 stop:1532 length:675 start_codon:yes stop_codon:yes gene_type:complete